MGTLCSATAFLAWFSKLSGGVEAAINPDGDMQEVKFRLISKTNFLN
jgi:hypothetical protein